MLCADCNDLNILKNTFVICCYSIKSKKFNFFDFSRQRNGVFFCHIIEMQKIKL